MRTKLRVTFLLLVLGVFGVTGVWAQALPAPNAGFDITGFIQSASLNAAPRPGQNPALRGGVIVVNGRAITVPDNMIVQFPASSWTWPQMFDFAAWGPVYDAAIVPQPPARPGPGAGRTGLALTDPIFNHFPSFEVRVVGNIITTPATGRQTYVAGLILPVTQQGLNSLSGYINFIDYASGRFRVGGVMGDATTGTLCEINDPVGRYGFAHSPDQRFQCDTNNPTISTANAYPCGIPKVAPTATPVPPGEIGDPDRPYTNRPANNPASVDPNQPFDAFLPAGAPLKTFTMPAAGGPAGSPDPTRQVPLMVGDWVDVSGTTMLINPTTGGVAVANQFFSVHTLTAHLSVKTQPGTLPGYIRVEEFLFGVGDGTGSGPTVAGIAQETSTRVALVAFTTDANPTGVNLPGGAIFGIDVNPTTGVETELQFPNGSTALSPPGSRDPFEMDDPIRGRIRWNPAKNPRPPLVGSNAVGTRKFYREYVVKLTGTGRGTVQLPNQVGLNGAVLPGLIAGQYRLPIFDYLFGEGTTFGQPWPPFNFTDFGFLTKGQGPTGPSGAVIGPLSPFPAFN